MPSGICMLWCCYICSLGRADLKSINFPFEAAILYLWCVRASNFYLPLHYDALYLAVFMKDKKKLV